jgi:hypothetical protein
MSTNDSFMIISLAIRIVLRNGDKFEGNKNTRFINRILSEILDNTTKYVTIEKSQIRKEEIFSFEIFDRKR